MNFEKGSLFLLFAMLIVAGCANAADPGGHSLTRQQSATIESLQDEILRLNQELDGSVSSREDLLAAKPKIEKMFSEQIARGDMWTALGPRGLEVAVLDHALFDPDESQFTPAGEMIMEKMASVLSGELPKNRVFLEGHTDNQPIEGAEGVTNWEYSIGRASAVLHYWVDVQGLAPERFGVAGYAEYRPVASNLTEEGRDRNRRVEIVISAQKVADTVER